MNFVQSSLFSMASTSLSKKAEFEGIGRLNHVAIVVPDLQKAADFYRNVMKSKVSEPVEQPEHGVTVIFVELENTKLELLHPLGKDSPVANFLEKNKTGGIHHVCFNVKDLSTAVKQMKDNNVRSLGKPKIGAHGLPVIFLHPKDNNGVLTELEEHKELKE